MDELSASEALIGFCAWLSSRKEKTVMSDSDDLANITCKVEEFCDVNNLTEPREDWSDYLSFPKEEV